MNTIKSASTYNFTIKKSKFIGFAYRVDSEDDAKRIILEIQKKYFDAKHIVYAYKIGENIIKKENSSEPAGTAGTPILCSIENKNLTNTIVVVVRYFGGILLGSSNLYRAYSDTAINTLNNTEIVELNKFIKYSFNVSYIDYAYINLLANKTNFVKVLDAQFDTDVKIQLALCAELNDSKVNELIKDCKPLGELWL